MLSCCTLEEQSVIDPECLELLFTVVARYISVLTVKKNAEALVAATKEIGLEVNAHKTKYMTMFQDQNAG